MELIYLNSNNQQLGPYSIEKVNKLIAQGKISLEDMAWTSGMEWWQPLNSQGFKELGIETGETTSISPSEVFQNPSIQNFSIEKAIRSAFHFFIKTGLVVSLG